MNDCPTCSYPLTWSTDRERVWCSLYGDHGAIPANVIQLRARPSALMLAADAELHGAPSDASGKLGRRLKAVS